MNGKEITCLVLGIFLAMILMAMAVEEKEAKKAEALDRIEQLEKLIQSTPKCEPQK